MPTRVPRRLPAGVVFLRRRLTAPGKPPKDGVYVYVNEDGNLARVNDQGTNATVGSGAAGGAITVQEVDGTPSVEASVLKVPNGSLTNNGDGSVTYTPAVSAPTFVGARVRNSADINVPDSAQTVMTFNTEDFDTDAFHSTLSNTSRLVIPSGKAGTYHVGGSVKCSAQYGWVVLLKNDDYIAAESLPGHPGPNGASLSTILDLAEADYLEIAIYQGSGGTLVSESVSGATPCLWCYKIG